MRARPAAKQGALRPQAQGIRRVDAGRGGAEALLYAPRGYSPARAAPLVVLLHGAGSGPRAGLEPLLQHADEAGRGRPSVYVSHGTGDDVLAIERCSRRIVPSLRDAGYRVRYREFDGGHAVPADFAEQAIRWTLGTRGQAGPAPQEGGGGSGSDA